jgi:hypothetical protein
MAVIPSFILKKLYVSGSLRNTGEGCQLQIKNTLAPATITGIGPVTIDGREYSPADVIVQRGNESLSAAEASATRPISFDINTVVTITIKNVTLTPGEHHIGLDVTSREAGRLKWDIADSVGG